MIFKLPHPCPLFPHLITINFLRLYFHHHKKSPPVVKPEGLNYVVKLKCFINARTARLHQKRNHLQSEHFHRNQNHVRH